MRIMAIDYGGARTGVAISDPTGLLAGFTTVIHSRKPEVVAAELARLAQEHRVEELVLGFPRNMDGTEGPRAELYRAFGKSFSSLDEWSAYVITSCRSFEKHFGKRADRVRVLYNSEIECRLYRFLGAPPKGRRGADDALHRDFPNPEGDCQ